MDNILYKRELNHSYMVIRSGQENIAESYAYRMMTQNHIGRLLVCRQRQLDGEFWLYYDISSRQPLERLYEAQKMGVEALGQIIHSIADMQEDLGEYLLDAQGLLLEAGTIFADVETEELFFGFDPGKGGAEQQYMKLADFFLGHVDHSDEHAVNIAYQFYKMSKSEYFVLSSFLPYLDRETEAWKKEKQQDNLEFWEEKSPLNVPEEETKLEELPEEKAGTKKAGAKKESWLKRLFGFGRRKADTEQKSEEVWPDTVWDSYAGQVDFAGTGETVYFTDLEKPVPIKRGMPCLQEENGERCFWLSDLPLTVGKLKGKVAIALTDSSVSRIHARFENGDGGILIRDLNSRNGTAVNGRKLAPNEAAEVNEGDLILFGRERFRYGFIDSNALK